LTKKFKTLKSLHPTLPHFMPMPSRYASESMCFRVSVVSVILSVLLSRCPETANSARLQGTARPGSSLHQVDVCTSLVVHGKVIAALGVKGHTSLFHALGSNSASAPSHSPVQQLETVYLTLYEALNPLTLSKDYLNPFYFQSHTLAFHFQLQHVIPLPCINLCNAPL